LRIGDSTEPQCLIVEPKLKNYAEESERSDVVNGQKSLDLIITYKTTRSCVDDKPISKKPLILWSKKQKRSFNTIKTGLRIAKKVKKPVRFLTLTTSDVQYHAENNNERKMYESFRKLDQRIKRMNVVKMVQQGYLLRKDIRHFYPSRNLVKTFDFEYFKVTTNEGNGVIHCLYRGEYLPYTYIVDNWQDIHNSWDVNIKLIHNHDKDLGKTACYVVSQYVSHQNSSYVRSSQSWNWVCRGYRSVWDGFISDCHTRFYYNPVRKRFYHVHSEVDLISLWDDYIYSKVRYRYEPRQVMLS